MLEKYQDQLLFEMQDAPGFWLVPDCENRSVWDHLPEDYRRQLIREAERMMEEPIPALYASDYMRFQRKGHRSAYSGPYFVRREMLNSLVMAQAARPDEHMDTRIADLIWAICEESSWVIPVNNPLTMGDNSLPLPDIYEPLVDAAAADTAADLCIAAQALGSRLHRITPQIIMRISYEVNRRIITPFLTAREFNWMCGSKADAAVCLRGVMMAFLTFETDGRRRWQCMHKACELLDRLLNRLPQDGSIPGGVSEWQATVDPIMDCLSMIKTATAGKVDASRERMIQLMCHYPVFCHIAQGWFVNPGPQSMRPELSAPAMFRIGYEARDGALRQLGAFLARTQGEGEKERLLLHRCQSAQLRARFESTEGAPPFRQAGCLLAQEILVARMQEDDEHGLAMAICGGNNGQIGGHQDVGNIVLFAHGQPVLVDAGCFSPTSMHSLPVIGDREQVTGANRRAEDVSYDLQPEYSMMSMNLAGLYPAEAHIMSWQRSAVYDRTDGMVQLMDVFDLNGFETVRFNFITVCKPVLAERYAQLGPVRLRWEAGLTVSADEIDITEEPWAKMWNGTLYRLTLTTCEPVNGGQYTFNFNALRTFG